MDFSASYIVDCIAEYQHYTSVAWFIEARLRGVQRYPVLITDFEETVGTPTNPIIVEDLGDQDNPIVIDWY